MSAEEHFTRLEKLIEDYKECSYENRKVILKRLDELDAKMAQIDEVVKVYHAAGVAAKVVKWGVGVLAGLAAVWAVVAGAFAKTTTT